MPPRLINVWQEQCRSAVGIVVQPAVASVIAALRQRRSFRLGCVQVAGAHLIQFMGNVAGPRIQLFVRLRKSLVKGRHYVAHLQVRETQTHYRT